MARAPVLERQESVTLSLFNPQVSWSISKHWSRLADTGMQNTWVEISSVQLKARSKFRCGHYWWLSRTGASTFAMGWIYPEFCLPGSNSFRLCSVETSKTLKWFMLAPPFGLWSNDPSAHSLRWSAFEAQLRVEKSHGYFMKTFPFACHTIICRFVTFLDKKVLKRSVW